MTKKEMRKAEFKREINFMLIITFIGFSLCSIYHFLIK
jgi:hypothetical protein